MTAIARKPVCYARACWSDKRRAHCVPLVIVRACLRVVAESVKRGDSGDRSYCVMEQMQSRPTMGAMLLSREDFGRVDMFVAGGPIDAYDYMPGGSWCADNYMNDLMLPYVAETIVHREWGRL